MPQSNYIERKLSVNSLLFFSGMFISRILVFFTFILISNFMGDEYFGKFSYAITYIGFFSIFLDLCSEYILVREFSKGKFKPSELFGTGLLLKGIFTFAAMLAAFLINYLFFRNKDVFIFILLLIISIPFSVKLQSMRSVFDSVCKSNFKVVHSSINDVMYHVVLFLLTILGIYFFISRQFLVWGYALCGIPGLIYLSAASIKIIKPAFVVNKKIIAYIIKESLPLAFLTLLLTLTARMDILMLKYFGDYSDVGLYAVVFRLCEPLTFIPASVVVSIYPLMSKLYHDESDNVAKIYGFGIKLMIMITIPMAVFISGYSETIIKLLFKPMYFSASTALSIYIFTIVFVFISVISNHFLVAAGKQTYILYIFITAAVLNFVLNLFLIPVYGYVGASIATVFTECLVCILYLWMTKSFLRGIKWNEIVKLIVIYGIGYIAFAYLKHFSIILAGVEMLILCQALVFLSGFYNKEEMFRIKNIFKL